MARITFRPGDDLQGLLLKRENETGLDQSTLCRIALREYLGRQKPQAIIKANVQHNIRRVRSANRKAAA